MTHAVVPLRLGVMSRRNLLIALLSLAWLLPGLLAHDPWKVDEAHTFGVVFLKWSRAAPGLRRRSPASRSSGNLRFTI